MRQNWHDRAAVLTRPCVIDFSLSVASPRRPQAPGSVAEVSPAVGSGSEERVLLSAKELAVEDGASRRYPRSAAGRRLG
jgi:hypothetical protein